MKIKNIRETIMHVNLGNKIISHYMSIDHLINYWNVQEVLSIYFTRREKQTKAAFPASAAQTHKSKFHFHGPMAGKVEEPLVKVGGS